MGGNSLSGPQPDWVSATLIKFGIPVIIVLVIILIVAVLTRWAQIKLFCADLLHAFGFLGGSFRKAVVRTEFESSMNSYSHMLNTRLDQPILPECQIRWVKPEEAESFLSGGRAIVCLSYSKRNHDKNFYLAARKYVESAFLHRAKDHLRKPFRSALDLFVTREILLQTRRAAITAFNESFTEEPDENKKTYSTLQNVHAAGFLQRLLIPELHSFGEEVFALVPDPRHQDEADRFLQWIYTIAVREEHERSDLAFQSEHLRTAVLLVADTTVYEKHGVAPYLRRAESYAIARFRSFYVVARGIPKVAVAKRISKQLQQTGNFQIIGRDHEITLYDRDHLPVLVTIIPIRPLTDQLFTRAWEIAQDHLRTKEPISVPIELVLPTSAKVNFRGLMVDIDAADLSDYVDIDVTVYFHQFDCIDVVVAEANPASGTIRLSNRGSRTDPKKIVERTGMGPGTPAEVTILRKIEKGGFEIALIGLDVRTNFEIFLPRRNLTFSRFVSILAMHPIGSHLRTVVDSFDSTHGNFVGRDPGLLDPWKHPFAFHVGDILRLTIHEVTDYVVVTEIAPGVEGVIDLSEIAWGSVDNNRVMIRKLRVGEEVVAKVLRIETGRRFVTLSIKQVMASPEGDFFAAHDGQIVTAEVEKVTPGGVRVAVGVERLRGFVPANEVMWIYCETVDVVLPPGSTRSFRVLRYDQQFNSVVLSAKQAAENRYDAFKAATPVGSTVSASIEAISGRCVAVGISFAGENCVAGYLHFSEASRIAFIDTSLASELFPPQTVLSFKVKGFDDRRKVVELSRRSWLSGSSFEPEYGTIYIGSAGYESKRRRHVFYSDDFEAVLRPQLGEGVRGVVHVIVSRRAEGLRPIEVAPT
jgi:predicted RNA-binding protein with RPS1 domain